MTKSVEDTSSHGNPAVPAPAEKLPPTGPNEIAPEDREYDHRGILLPRRTRVGGIIIPQ